MGGKSASAVIVAAVAVSLLPATAVGGKGARCIGGAAGAGDSYFPGYGNGGYDVDHYDLDIAYNPANDNLRGRAKVAGRRRPRTSAASTSTCSGST